ncbi:unnamed protein product [Linum trigynum]|uniref:Uncharacterized protein n=1 Tax=Linum trigynum TaxID=586398 RepID=A0AAV2CXW1_9ROSI
MSNKPPKTKSVTTSESSESDPGNALLLVVEEQIMGLEGRVDLVMERMEAIDHKIDDSVQVAIQRTNTVKEALGKQIEDAASIKASFVDQFGAMDYNLEAMNWRF